MKHPYQQQPNQAFWSRSVTKNSWFNVEFVAEKPRFLDATTKIATAGSCFAANLMRCLPQLGLTPFFTETAPEYFTAEDIKTHGYYEFSARYGNIYTVKQFRQLLEQALEYRPMIEEFIENEGTVYDLLRPHVRPDGFISLHEARADRRYHLSCVKRLLLECETFVFTLGLTEAWINSNTQTVYPVCPGTVAGKYDAELHQPINFDYISILTDMTWIVETMQQINPKLRWIITVSPVHLVATHSSSSVIVASTYSKSVLRAVCGALAMNYAHVFYFPSYEIIGSAQSFGQYLDSNLRDVTERGIAHVMEVFARAFINQAAAPSLNPQSVTTGFLASIEKQLNAECDELMNEPL